MPPDQSLSEYYFKLPKLRSRTSKPSGGPTVQFLETRLATSFGSSKGRTPTESGVAPTSKSIRVGADKHKGEA
jgi:hypothetical protein